MAKAKTLRLLLKDGSLDGLMNIEDSQWNSGKMYSAPRNRVDDLIKSDAINKYGVYLLLSDEKVYVGQSSDLANRIKQHIIGKDWWERVVVLTTKEDSLTKSDIDFLEWALIEEAKKNNVLDSDNKKTGNNPKVDEFRRAELEQYLEEAHFLLELISINVFKNKPVEKKKKNNTPNGLIKAIESNNSTTVMIRAKKEARDYLYSININLSANTNDWSYGKLQEKTGTYWLNPDVTLLSKPWTIVLNNQVKKIITIISVPANRFTHSKGMRGSFYCRKDKPNLIDLNISADTLVDRRSKIDLSEYVINSIEY